MRFCGVAKKKKCIHELGSFMFMFVYVVTTSQKAIYAVRDLNAFITVYRENVFVNKTTVIRI